MSRGVYSLSALGGNLPPSQLGCPAFPLFSPFPSSPSRSLPFFSPFQSLPFLSLFFPISPIPPLSSRIPWMQLKGLRERCKLPQRGLGRSPSRNQIWCILAFKIWHVVRKKLIIFYIIKWPNLVPFQQYRQTRVTWHHNCKSRQDQNWYFWFGEGLNFSSFSLFFTPPPFFFLFLAFSFSLLSPFPLSPFSSLLFP